MSMKSIKIGLVTMHRVPNFGSLLQAYATQRFFYELGYDCEIIDYLYPDDDYFKRKGRKPYMTKNPKFILINLIKGNKKNVIDYLYQNNFYRLRKNLLKVTHRTYNLERLCSCIDSMNYDAFCIGSDQVWNPKYTMNEGAFVLSFVPDNITKFSFSASLVVKNMPDDKSMSFYADNLSRFRTISVREESGIELIKQMTGKKAVAVLDPVFLIPAEQWIKSFQIKQYKKNYIYVFSYNYMADSKSKILELLACLLKQYSNKYEIVSNNILNIDANVRVIRHFSVKSFLECIANASVVITDSFHVSAFSLIFNVKVYAFSNLENDDRINSLFNRLGLKDYIFDINDAVDKVETAEPDYGYVNDYILKNKENSILFVNDSVNP